MQYQQTHICLCFIVGSPNISLLERVEQSPSDHISIVISSIRKINKLLTMITLLFVLWFLCKDIKDRYFLYFNFLW